jgi:prepilin-type N-terminal cleavage/methylation domain-containing protein/prepilin-type processing-associated H-X9-DG protein
MSKQEAFTLIELLVVIAIIALLMAILMPSLQKAKKETKAVVCRSRLRQWGLVWAMYTDENNGKFPGYLGPDWMQILVDYYRKNEKLLYCPMTTKTLSEGAPLRYAIIEAGGQRRGSYSLNEWIYDSQDTSGGRSLEDYWRNISHRGLNNVPVMGDGAWRSDAQPNHTDEPPQFEGQPRGGVNNNEIRIYCIPRHDNSVNMLFADWSTREVGLKGLWRLKWNRSSDVTAPLPAWPPWMSRFKEP